MGKKRESADDYMARLEHPLKAEVQALRDIIKGVDPRISEEVKWNAPSFSHTEYIVTFNLRTTKHVHLVFHNPNIASVQSNILEGDYADRRMAYFTDMDDVIAKQPELEAIVRELIRIMDAQVR